VRNVIDYYLEFNKEYITGEQPLGVLSYIAKYGDENIALYEFRKKNTTSKDAEVP
jgi:hypothetical protein